MTSCVRIPSPVGELLVAADDDGLLAICFEEERHARADRGTWVERSHASPAARSILDTTREQLDAWFAGERRSFDLPLVPAGTSFQRRVWDALREIPFGQTISYRELARRMGSPDAVRAVGAANGRNPIPIVVPCHRVIGADGSLVGFGGGLDRKRWLLHHEGALSAPLELSLT